MQGTEYSQPETERAESIAPEERRLIDCRPGERVVDGVFAICDKQLKKTGAGKPYLQFKLRDGTDERMAKWFTPPDDAFENLRAADFVRVTAFVDLNPAFLGDFKITACEAIDAPADRMPFLAPLPSNHAAHEARFKDIVRAVKNPCLFALLKEIFRPAGELWPRFKVAPAARKLHHAYRGGLLEHTAEVALLCDRVAATLPHLDRDLLLTAALLHDIGKLEEMESELSSGEYTPAGHLVGHIVLGTCTVANAIEKVENFPLELKHELMHLILSHHGRPEYGAAKIPMCAEAVVLSMCDLMSAKTAQCREKIEGGLEGDFLSKQDSYGWDSEKIYLGSMRRMLQSANGTTTEPEA
jgi:3'-5' exoribonuclease